MKEVNIVFETLKEMAYSSELKDLIVGIQEMYNQKEELQQRINKAIEYIEKYVTEKGETLPYYNYQKVIAILKGVDKE